MIHSSTIVFLLKNVDMRLVYAISLLLTRIMAVEYLNNRFNSSKRAALSHPVVGEQVPAHLLARSVLYFLVRQAVVV